MGLELKAKAERGVLFNGRGGVACSGKNLGRAQAVGVEVGVLFGEDEWEEEAEEEVEECLGLEALLCFGSIGGLLGDLEKTTSEGPCRCLSGGDPGPLAECVPGKKETGHWGMSMPVLFRWLLKIALLTLLLCSEDIEAEEVVFCSGDCDFSSLSSVEQRRSLAKENIGTRCVTDRTYSSSSMFLITIVNVI